ncbi:MAG: vitamin B12 dependent-methionine synthase activation domain-containing protein [Bacteroidales bacterium]|nr:vitamin B12 dependent-methionine synthase activation domain-containing protein [Bacteroidales bacterium]
MPLDIHYAQPDKSKLQIDRLEILRLLGEQAKGIKAHTCSLIDTYIPKCLELSSPSGAYILTEALEPATASEIHIPGIRFDSGKIIPKMLRGSQLYAFFLVSAGPEPENLARSLIAEGSYLEGYIADLLASAIVDLAADQVQEEVRKLAGSRGLQISNRYSPGYCSWRVEEQQKLFSLFPGKCCGITLSESSLMNPVKSISGIIGMGLQVKYREYTCEICSMKNCNFRRTKGN